MKFLKKKVQEFVSILLFIGLDTFIGWLGGEDEAAQDVLCCPCAGCLGVVELLEHVVHEAAQARFVVKRLCTGRRLVALAEIEVPHQWIVYQRLEDDGHIACRTHVPYASDSGYAATLLACILAGHFDGVLLKEFGIFIMLSL